MKKMFNIYSRKVNKGEVCMCVCAHVCVSCAQNLSVGDSGAVCERGSACLKLCIPPSLSVSACVPASSRLASIRHSVVCIAAMFR